MVVMMISGAKMSPLAGQPAPWTWTTDGAAIDTESARDSES